MKKLFVAASLLAASFGVFAQDTKAPEQTGEGFVSKNGHQVLPEAGDIGLAFNAIPVLEFVGNSFNNSGFNTINSAFPNNVLNSNVITGKYFTDAKTAIRAKVRIGLTSNTTTTLVTKIGGAAGELVENKTKTKNTEVALALGLEKRRGHGRVQGFYGAELWLGINGTANVKNEYGNAISATNPVGSRTLETKNGNTLQVGPRGFIGADYFIAPKIALGAEFGWGILFTTTAKSEVKTEGWDAANSTVKTTTTQTSKGPSSLGIDTDNLSGAINLSFYF